MMISENTFHGYVPQEILSWEGGGMGKNAPIGPPIRENIEKKWVWIFQGLPSADRLPWNQLI